MKHEHEMHPLLCGLFDELPEPGETWPQAHRERWLRSAAAIFDMIYDRPVGRESPASWFRRSGRGGRDTRDAEPAQIASRTRDADATLALIRRELDVAAQREANRLRDGKAEPETAYRVLTDLRMRWFGFTTEKS